MLKRLRKTVLKPEQLSEFCGHVGAMISAGVPLAQTMEILQHGTENKRIRALYEQLKDSMQRGCSFSAALAETKVFPELLLNMFRAAEADGHLDETANRMAIYYRKEHRMRSQIQTATLYPKILSVVSVFVVMIVFLVVVPTVEPLFRGTELPILTRMLMFISRMIKEYWYVCIVFMLLVSIIVHVLSKKRRIRTALERLKLHMPLIGKQLRVIYTARFARSESSLYGCGLPMVEGIGIAASTIGCGYLEDQMTKVMDMVQGGMSFSQAIESVDGFDKKLAPVIFVGEESGKLDEMLERISESYEYEAEAALNRLVSMIEPAMIIIMGLVIGLILLGIMIPMWSMYEYLV